MTEQLNAQFWVMNYNTETALMKHVKHANYTKYII